MRPTILLDLFYFLALGTLLPTTLGSSIDMIKSTLKATKTSCLKRNEPQESFNLARHFIDIYRSSHPSLDPQGEALALWRSSQAWAKPCLEEISQQIPRMFIYIYTDFKGSPQELSDAFDLLPTAVETFGRISLTLSGLAPHGGTQTSLDNRIEAIYKDIPAQSLPSTPREGRWTDMRLIRLLSRLPRAIVGAAMVRWTLNKDVSGELSSLIDPLRPYIEYRKLHRLTTLHGFEELERLILITVSPMDQREDPALRTPKGMDKEEGGVLYSLVRNQYQLGYALSVVYLKRLLDILTVAVEAVREVKAAIRKHPLITLTTAHPARFVLTFAQASALRTSLAAPALAPDASPILHALQQHYTCVHRALARFTRTNPNLDPIIRTPILDLITLIPSLTELLTRTPVAVPESHPRSIRGRRIQKPRWARRDIWVRADEVKRKFLALKIPEDVSFSILKVVLHRCPPGGRITPWSKKEMTSYLNEANRLRDIPALDSSSRPAKRPVDNR